ncbi:helix-turn-helix transcriptional regulator [Kribbella solani]|uniref:helix-turn-helix domain-containing protein n=1 Tax=Kribbella solani TaxID=236067 RepID=UPI0029BB579F|nr:helix-turn-helix transcriptional regulator [Kribbella solani]MDX2974105.1 helix-turn-helix transcriptional regulator [Kribbella solani]MDX3002716.1 helix-turn-helix transcriptional regulator [Kribbella solani]
MTEPGAYGGPTALRIMLGVHLRRLREDAGVTRSDAGWAIRGSESKISRLELGRVGFKVRDVDDLLTLYKLDDPEERDRLLTLAREANNPGWWQRYDDLTPAWFHSYLGLEMAADLIRTFELQFVPGLLQTPEYARAVVQLGQQDQPLSRAEQDRLISLRMSRQEVLTRQRPARLWAVVDESVLRRPIGGVKVLRAQLEFLLEASRRHNVTLQIIPFEKGGYTSTGGAFTLLRFNDADLPDIVYIEHLTSAVYLDKREELDTYAVTMDAVSITAAQPRETEALIRRAIEATDNY